MQIILKNSEEQFLKDAKNAWEVDPHLRCLYFMQAKTSGSSCEENSENPQWIPNLLNELRTFIDEEGMRVYVCHDKDVFILVRALTNKRLQEFLHHLEARLGPASFMGLAYLFEVGVDWPKLRAIGERKIELFRRFVEKKKKAPHDTDVFGACVQPEHVLARVEKGVIASVAERRSARREPFVLVVEDDHFSQRLVSLALRDKYALAVVPDGQGAILSYVKYAPDILFLDIGLPDIDGHAVLERLFSIDPEAYVVMFSGNGNKDNILKARELGAKGFVGKPFTQEKLFWYIERSPFIQSKLSKEHYHGDLVS
ncbi:MAG: response regulator [Rhodospirillales bacterium]|nr:response regulator [Alphaproteobacteria bacterium]MCB1839668.1 response regulator [Alphaproteobacteria bacterium]MCB9977953.1 response regulator [Rhodospirillales bacterium]